MLDVQQCTAAKLGTLSRALPLLPRAVRIRRWQSEGTKMAGKADFSPDEWQQVIGGVFLAGFAVSAAEPSGLWGMLKETFASGQAVLEARATAGDNALMQAIIADFETSEGRTAAQTFVKGRLEGAKGEELKQRAIEAVRQVAGIVQQKAPHEATAFKGWLLKIASRVAEAAKEGGFLGIGGVPVSAAEKAALDEISAALGTKP
jgi:hypothetical protein